MYEVMHVANQMPLSSPFLPYTYSQKCASSVKQNAQQKIITKTL